MTLLGDLYINEQRQYYPYFYPNEANPKVTIRQNGWLKTIETEKGINVAFNGYTVCVTIPDCDAFYGKDKLCGLGGNYDGICANDVVYKNGTIPPPLVPCRFGNTISDWANSFITTNYFYPNNATKECKVGSNSNGCNRIEAGSDVACKPISDAATGTGVFKQCKAMGNDVIERMNEACKYDVCLIKEHLCQAFEDFALECQRMLNSTDLGDWRATTNCPAKQCPANSSFKTCVHSCQPTCKDPNPTGCNVNSCIEGCQCNTGFVIDNTKTPFTCIKAEDCNSCIGTFPNYPTISNNCTLFNTCWKKGKRISRPYQCGINEQCGKSGEVESCQSQSCPVGWRFFDKTKACYKTIYNVSFDQAQAQCQTLGSNLVSINSLEENEFVRSMIYIGTTDVELTDDTYIGFKNAVMPDPFLIEHKVPDYCWFMISDNPSPEYSYLQGQWYISNCDRVFRTAVCKKI
uniref:VWFD domain-containing protein n=1 Tax=Panagrolaimus davidi TaxID=227884 RepID=A0A914R3V7_9BILA